MGLGNTLADSWWITTTLDSGRREYPCLASIPTRNRGAALPLVGAGGTVRPDRNAVTASLDRSDPPGKAGFKRIHRRCLGVVAASVSTATARMGRSGQQSARVVRKKVLRS